MISSSLGIEAVVRALKAFPSSGEVQMNGLAAVQAITSDNEDRTLEGRRAKEIGVIYHRIHVWYIYLHLPLKNQRHVGKYARDGAFGYNSRKRF